MTNERLVNKFFNFEGTQQMKQTESNNLWKAIQKLKQVGSKYSTDGAEQFADNTGTLFEKEFESCLKACDIEERNGIDLVGYSTTQLKEILKQPDNDLLWTELEDRFIRVFQDNNIFIPQPAGGKHEPDFIVYYERKIYPIECKKRDGKSPVYGDNGCHPRTIYLMKGLWKRQLTHTYWLGSDLMSTEKYIEGLEQRENAKYAIKNILSEYSMVNDVSRLGTNQKVDDVIGHPNRHQYEANVQNYILDKVSIGE